MKSYIDFGKLAVINLKLNSLIAIFRNVRLDTPIHCLMARYIEYLSCRVLVSMPWHCLCILSRHHLGLLVQLGLWLRVLVHQGLTTKFICTGHTGILWDICCCGLFHVIDG